MVRLRLDRQLEDVDVYMSRSGHKQFGYEHRAKAVMEKHGSVKLHGVGGAILPVCQMALLIEKAYPDSTKQIDTGTVIVVDEVLDSNGNKEYVKRSVSSISILIVKPISSKRKR